MVRLGGTFGVLVARVALPALVWACSGNASGPAPAPPPPPPPCASTATAQVIAATPVDEVNFLDELLWASSGNEILYTSEPISGPFALKAFDVVSQVVRVLDGRNAYYKSLVLSPDGQSVFYAAALDLQRPSYTIYRTPVAGGSPERLVDSVDAGFLLSPDGVHVAYAPEESPDSALLLDLVTKARTFVTRGNLVAFSPDGLELLMSSQPVGAAESYFVVTVGNGATEPVPGLTRPLIVRWDPDGIRALVVADSSPLYNDLYIRNFTTNTSTKMACPVPAFVWRWNVSPDGQRVGYWVEPGGAGPLPAMLVLASAQEAHVLRATDGRDPVGTIAFAPDGGRLAYISGTQILISPLPLGEIAAIPPFDAAKTP